MAKAASEIRIGIASGSSNSTCTASPMLKRQNGQVFIPSASRQHLHIAMYDSLFSLSFMASSFLAASTHRNNVADGNSMDNSYCMETANFHNK